LAQLIVAQRKFSYTHKYDSDMEILLNVREMETFKNSIYQSFATVAKSAVNFILENFILPELGMHVTRFKN